MNPLQKAAFYRKIYYLAAVLVLFTISMFWRGIIPIPLSGTARPASRRRASSASPTGSAATPSSTRPRSLDLREVEHGDNELEGSFARLALIGSNGFAVTWCWYDMMDAQKRNDFHKMETLINVVTRLQPHFIYPWIYQSWNISYNVSVTKEGSGDMYHYIARGIDLLAEGERRNTHIYEGRKVGSPDMRYWIAFYYQNKFGVSDQVEVLRCLFELSCMSPDEREPRPAHRQADGQGGPPQVPPVLQELSALGPPAPRRRRRRRQQRRTDQAEGAGGSQVPAPEDIVQFLRENAEVPSRYKGPKQLADVEKQFPALPPKFSEDEAHPGSSDQDINDDFTAYLAARAWYLYSLLPVPPNPLDSYNEPWPCGPLRPAASGDEVRAGEYDPFRYRIPRQPMLIIFRQGAPRVQTSQAEQEQKEGWFDAEGWRIDDPSETNTRKWWFPDPDAPKGVQRPLDIVVGRSKEWSLDAWKTAAQMWRKHGHDNALIISPERRQRWETLVQAPGGLPADPNDKELADLKLRRQYEAKVALFFYPQNRGVTNFPFFLASSQAEARPETVNARKILWHAEQARKLGRTFKAIELYEDGLKKWKAVLAKDADFHRPERSDHTEEATFTYELAYLRLLVQDDERVRVRAREIAQRLAHAMRAAGAVLPFQPFTFQLALPAWSKGSTTFLGSALLHAAASGAAVPEWKGDALEDLKWYVAENELSPFAKEMTEADGVTDRERLGTPWVRPGTKANVRMQQGVGRQPPPQPPSTPRPAATAPTGTPNQ